MLHPLSIGYLMQADSVDMDVTSGPQLHVTAIYNGLARRGHRVRMLALRGGTIQVTEDLVHWHPSRLGTTNTVPFRHAESLVRRIQTVGRFPFLRAFDSLRYSDAGVHAFRGFDVLYERFGVLSYGGLITATRLRLPIVLELNGDLLAEYEALGMKNRLSATQWRLIRWATRVMCRRASRLVTVSDVLRRRVVQQYGVSPSKVVVVENGAHIERFLGSSDTAETRKHYGLGAGPLVMLVCSFEPWHGVDLILEAHRTLIREFPDAMLVLVGDGRLRNAINDMAEHFGVSANVRFTGLVSHAAIPGLLAAADVAVVSQYGLAADAALSPLKLFEYMAAGNAIVASRTDATERILEDGVTGRLVPPGDPKAFADVIGSLLRHPDLRARLGLEARRVALERHSWDRTIGGIEGVLRDVVQEAAG